MATTVRARLTVATLEVELTTTGEWHPCRLHRPGSCDCTEDAGARCVWIDCPHVAGDDKGGYIGKEWWCQEHFNEALQEHESVMLPPPPESEVQLPALPALPVGKDIAATAVETVRPARVA